MFFFQLPDLTILNFHLQKLAKILLRNPIYSSCSLINLTFCITAVWGWVGKSAACLCFLRAVWKKLMILCPLKSPEILLTNYVHWSTSGKLTWHRHNSVMTCCAWPVGFVQILPLLIKSSCVCFSDVCCMLWIVWWVQSLGLLYCTR